MKARRIHPGKAYWVKHDGEQIKVVVRCEAHTDSPEWVCEGPGKLFVSVPPTAFIRAAARGMRSIVLDSLPHRSI